MARRNISIQEISEVLGAARDTVSSKLSRKRQITLKEAFLIENTFFPGMGVLYLFEELNVSQKPA